MRVLVVNAGSSSLKLRLLDDGDAVLGAEDLTATAGEYDDAELRRALRRLGADGPPDAVGHRVVHGGGEFRGPVRLDDAVLRRLDALSPLAPLHQPYGLAGVRAVSAALPRVPAVACFDTAFHAGLPDAAATYPLPAEWRQRHRIRRYGFHGLSHANIARRAVAWCPGAARVVSCHLGSGASLCAIRDGRSVDTTMGFTPLEGVMMGTRSGTVDPGIVLWLQQHAGLAPDEVGAGLEKRSGLRGLAGTGDMREVLSAADDGDADAALALRVYGHRLRAGIAAMTAALGGLDVLVFTGGVGENAAPVRADAAAGLGFLGVAVDTGRNASERPDAELTADGATVRTLLLAAREDAEIATEVRTVLGQAGAAGP